MLNGLHFISGLPRSGSTLLSALLLQNPKLHANITSPVGPVFLSALREMSASAEGEVFIDNAQRAAILRGIFDGYYHAIHPTKTVFDTNRLWTAKLPTLADLYPSSKVICCVRDMGWIYDSFEALIRRNRYQPSRIFDFDAGGTVYTRFNALNLSTGIIGFAWTALRTGFFSDQADRMMLVTFESLTRSPAKTLDAIYQFCELEPFQHDFDNVTFSTPEYDARLGTPGLHDVSRKVKQQRRSTILPPDLFHRAEEDNFWKDPSKNIRDVRIV